MVHQQHQYSEQSNKVSDNIPLLKSWSGQQYRDEEQLHNKIDSLYWPVTCWLITFSNLFFTASAFWTSGGNYDWTKHWAPISIFVFSLAGVAFVHKHLLGKENVRHDN